MDKTIKTCSYIFVKGDKKGQTCTTSVKDDNDMCKIHMTSIEKKKNSSVDSTLSDKSIKSDEDKTTIKTCSYVFVKGDKKGQTCTTVVKDNNDMCKIHMTSTEKKKNSSVDSTLSDKSIKFDEEKTTIKTCSYVFVKGDKKGETCTTLVKDDNDMCKIHMASIEKKKNSSVDSYLSELSIKSNADSDSNVSLCTFILVKGDRKGNQCGKKVCKNSDNYCTSHFKSST
jgi:hypothetical protein